MFLVCLFFCASASATTVIFCYEDKSVPPFYTGTGSGVPVNAPGGTIDMLRQADAALNNISFRFVRQPWKRCLDDLKRGKVDALIASYTHKRDRLYTYPKKNDKLDSRLHVGSHATCLVTREDFPNNPFDTRNEPIATAIPRGHSVLNEVKALNASIVYTNSTEQSLFLLDQRRVDASVVLCNLTGNHQAIFKKQGLKLHYPPLRVKTGYLIFNNEYYGNNRKTCHQVWHYLSQLDHYSFYNDYLK